MSRSDGSTRRVQMYALGQSRQFPFICEIQCIVFGNYSPFDTISETQCIQLPTQRAVMVSPAVQTARGPTSGIKRFRLTMTPRVPFVAGPPGCAQYAGRRRVTTVWRGLRPDGRSISLHSAHFRHSVRLYPPSYSLTSLVLFSRAVSPVRLEEGDVA